MKIDPHEFNQNVWNVLTHLVEEIGPRPAGSDAEKESLDWLEEQFKAAHLQTTRFPVKFQADPAFFPYYTLAAIGFVAAGIILPIFGWLCLILPLIVFLLPEAVPWLQKKLTLFNKGSSNLLVMPDSVNLDQTDIIFCAHMDTARAIPRGPAFWQKWRNEIFYTMMRVSILLAIWGTLQAAGFTFSVFILSLGQYLAYGMAGILVVQDLWEQIGSNDQFTPGANDNASGVATLAALALALAQDGPKNLRVGFLFTGAEECGLHGAEQFAEHLTGLQLKPIVISVDMVGAGKGLRIITRSGTVFPVYTNDEVNQLLKRADPLAVFHAAPRRWGDFVPFARAGIPSGHIENTGTPYSWSVYHTDRDDLDRIDGEMLDYVGNILSQFIWVLDKNKTILD
jgi:hypothetical protein